MKHSFKPSGNVCAARIEFEIDDQSRVHNLEFHGGCAGNTSGISRLVEGMPAGEVARKLRGIQCRNGTSCPDQLARALEAAGIR